MHIEEILVQNRNDTREEMQKRIRARGYIRRNDQGLTSQNIEEIEVDLEKSWQIIEDVADELQYI